MKILFSYPEELDNEVVLINKLMNSGKWDCFHLRKPSWDESRVREMYNQLDEKVKTITVFHKDYNGSCHSFEEVEVLEGKLKYCFLSPIFDSISKEGYKAKFEAEELKQFLKRDRKIKVIALGGVTNDNYLKLIKLGFDGAAFLGSVWSKYLCHSEQNFSENLFSSKNDLKNL